MIGSCVRMAALAPLVLTVFLSGCSGTSSSKEEAAPSGNVAPSGTSTVGTDDITYTTEDFGGSKGVEGCGQSANFMICGWVYLHKGLDDDPKTPSPRSAVWAKTGVLGPANLRNNDPGGQVVTGEGKIFIVAEPEDVAPIATIGYIGYIGEFKSSRRKPFGGYNQWHGVKDSADNDLAGSGARLDYSVDAKALTHSQSCVGSGFFSCEVYPHTPEYAPLYLRTGVWTHPLQVSVINKLHGGVGTNNLVRQGDVNGVFAGSATVMNIVKGSAGPVESGSASTGTPASQIGSEPGSNSGSYGMLLAGDGATAKLQYKVAGGGYYDGALVNINIDYSNHGDGAGNSTCTVVPAVQGPFPRCFVTGTGKWDHPQSLQVTIS